MLLLLVTLLLPGWRMGVAAELPAVRITLLISGSADIHLDTVKGFKERLEGLVDRNVQIRTVNLSNNSDDERIYKETDYIISIGSHAAHKVLQLRRKTPVLSILVPRATYTSLSREIYGPDSLPANFSVIYLDQPVSRILRLAKLIAGNPAPAMGTLFGPDSRDKQQAMLRSAKLLGIRLLHSTVQNEQEIIPELRQLFSQTGLFIALYDSEIINRRTAKWLLYLAYQRREPVIGYSEAFVKAGAVAAVHSTPEMFGKMSAEWLAGSIKASAYRQWRKYPDIFTVSVNREIGKQLQLNVADPDSLVKKLMESE